MYKRTVEGRTKAIRRLKRQNRQRGSNQDYINVLLFEYHQSKARIQRANQVSLE